MKSTIIRSEVAEVSFGFYSDEEIRNVSCCQVCSPIAFDALGNPLSSGLYDPKLGPTSQHSLPCPTCGLLYINCPGHPGHIELAVPVYHPLMFANMFQLLRAQCANCHKFRIPSSKVRITLIKLKLLEIGLVKESEEVEDLLNPPVIFNDSTACDAADATVDIESQLSRYEELYTTHIQKFPESRPDSFLKRLQREVIDSFIKAALVCKKCDSCGSFSPPLRKDGHAKLFEKPLAKRIRKSMQGMKIKLKPALETLARDDHMAADISDDSDDDMVLNADDSEEEGEARYSEKDKYLAPFEVEARMKLLWKSHHEYLDFVWGRVSLRAAAIFKKSVLPEHSTLWRIFL